jgi:uncharacterized repeat protein (TIGR01451 family)
MNKEILRMTSASMLFARHFRLIIGSALVALMMVLPTAPASAATEAPAWSLSSTATPTNFNQTKPGEYTYEVRFANIGAVGSNGSPVTITDTLPEGLSVEKVEFNVRFKEQFKNFGVPPSAGVPTFCKSEKPAETATVTCTLPGSLPPALESSDEPSVIYPSEEIRLVVFVTVPPTIPEGATLVNEATIEGGGAPTVSTASQNEASVNDAPAGFAEFEASVTGPDGQPVTQAGSHPFQFNTNFSFNTRPRSPGTDSSSPKFVPSGGDPKTTPVALPPGLIGNPTATTRCTIKQFNTTFSISPFGPGRTITQNECPDGSAVGVITLRRVDQAETSVTPIFNMVPPHGEPAQLGFQFATTPFFIDTEVRPEENYKVVGVVRNINEAKRVVAASVTLWGTPSDPRHDELRGHCLNPFVNIDRNSLGACAAGIEEKPFLRMPTSCGSPLDVTMGLDTWGNPGNFVSSSSILPAVTGCAVVDFDPSFEARPTTNVADSPSGLHADLHLPQNDDPVGNGTADLRKAVVTLPKGLVVNPAQANGLEACTSGQIGLDVSSPSGFNDEPAGCPDAAKIGKVEVNTPLLDKPLFGSVYVAAPFDNPFDSLLAIYLAVHDPERGIVVKLAGHVETDKETGQVTTTFDNNPQVPFEHFKLDFFSGAVAPLRTPSTCGTYSTTSELTPWSAPESGPPATPSDTYTINSAPGGGACANTLGELPHSPSFSAGTASPLAGAYSPFVLNLRRDDGSQEFGAITAAFPPGLLAKLVGIPYCSDGSLAAAAAQSGNAEKANPSCPAASQLGTVEVGAGAGPAPYYAQGKAYLAGPYKGGPLSIAIVTPATAGPFDLGTVVVRTALYIDPETTKVTAKSDPIPHILEGIPLDVRSVVVKVDKPKFMLNPTNCDPFEVGGTLFSTQGQAASLASHFQVADCARLPFKPRLQLRLKGGTKRAKNPKLIATLTAKEGEGNIYRASVKLPRSAFLDQAHIRTVCTRVQWAAEACPRGSIYGRAWAESPLLDYRVSGKVYLRSSNNKLPDLVIDLRGPAYQPVRATLVGRTDAVKGALRNTFDFVPDVPVSKFRLELFGGKRGLVVNSRNICAHRYRAAVKLDSQSGKIFDTRPLVRNSCKSGTKQKKARRHQRHR